MYHAHRPSNPAVPPRSTEPRSVSATRPTPTWDLNDAAFHSLKASPFSSQPPA
jgi:hypothetical protein